MTSSETTAYIAALREAAKLIDTETSVLSRQEVVDKINNRISEMELSLTRKQVGFVEPKELDETAFGLINDYRAGKFKK